MSIPNAAKNFFMEPEELPDGLTRINMGPSHPATHGILHNVIDLDGERIINARPILGYIHRTFDKMAESYTYNQFLVCTDRMNYVSAPMNNIGWCLAVEEMAGLKVPLRAQVVRTIINELSRISDHIICNGIVGVDTGAFTGLLYLYHFREKITKIQEKMTGARLTTAFCRVGGLEMDIYKEFADDVKDFIKTFPAILKDFRNLFVRNRIFIDRTKGIGKISQEDALAYGFTGPNLRATGCDYDVRRTYPYLVYDKVNFDIPVGTDGSVFDRFLVRLEEMYQSLSIVQQLIDNIPAGPFQIEDYQYMFPPKEEVYEKMEQLIFHFQMLNNGIIIPPGEYYSCTEAANGELGFYIISDGKNNPYRVHTRRPCFWFYQAYPELIKGGLIADAVATMSSLNVIAGELDG